jgi:thiamine biosynthesis lipoprotein
MQITLDALGTSWWITMPVEFKNLESEVISIITTFESNYSRFESNSLVGKLNTNKFLMNPPRELVDMLTYALDVYSQTDGVFNISIGSELEKSGYGKESDKKSRISNNLLKDIVFSDKEITISDSTRIDLGGFGKGWLIEKVAGFLKEKGVKDFTINGGGDITSRGKSANIYLENPLNPTEYIGQVKLDNNSVASSSNIKRSWENKGIKHSHVIHPSGKNLDDVLSVHVMAGNILFADTFATIFLLVDRRKRLEYSSRYGFEFMEVLTGNNTFRTPGFSFVPNNV